MGLQHAMAMLAGLTTVPYLIGSNAFNVREASTSKGFAQYCPSPPQECSACLTAHAPAASRPPAGVRQQRQLSHPGQAGPASRPTCRCRIRRCPHQRQPPTSSTSSPPPLLCAVSPLVRAHGPQLGPTPEGNTALPAAPCAAAVPLPDAQAGHKGRQLGARRAKLNPDCSAMLTGLSHVRAAIQVTGIPLPFKNRQLGAGILSVMGISFTTFAPANSTIQTLMKVGGLGGQCPVGSLGPYTLGSRARSLLLVASAPAEPGAALITGCIGRVAG